MKEASSIFDHWLKVAANLRVDRKSGIAPHKPLLLLVLAELAEEGLLKNINLQLSGELVFRFLTFWTIVVERRRQKPDIHLPFYHMRSDECWIPLDESGAPTFERRRAVIAHIQVDFFDCLNDEEFRNRFRRIIIAKYFLDAGERAALYQLVGLRTPPVDVVKADARLYENSRERGREARFRLTVVPAYNYTCALTGYRCTTIEAGSIVDAAHIHQFSDSRNNHPQNGIALSKNAHWLFDQGLWSLTDDYRVIVAKEMFEEAGAASYSLKKLEGKQIHLPKNKAYWPDKKNLEWHRKKKMQQWHTAVFEL